MDSLFQEYGALSLAYNSLNNLPSVILIYLGEKTKILDLSHNELQDLTFLKSFPNLHTLILDRNPNPDNTTLPYMPNLKILWLNNCNIINTNEWLHTLQVQCPQLRQLSMMCNPVGLTQLNGVTNSDENKYRQEIIRILPNLEYFDGIFITDKERYKSNNKNNINSNESNIYIFFKKLFANSHFKDFLNLSVINKHIGHLKFQTNSYELLK